MFVQKACQQVFAACFSLSLCVGLESKASALVPNYTDNYIGFTTLNIPSDNEDYYFTAFLGDSNPGDNTVGVQTAVI